VARLAGAANRDMTCPGRITRHSENGRCEADLSGLIWPICRVSRLRRLLFSRLHQLMQGEGHFVWMRCAPRDDPLQLDEIVGNGADFHQFGFDCLRIAHSSFSIAHRGNRNVSRGDRECTGRRIVILEAAADQKPTCGDQSLVRLQSQFRIADRPPLPE
jgi:hypothetical protein